MVDEESKLVSPFTMDPKGGTLSVKVSPTLDPWTPTNGSTAAQ